MDIRKLVNDLHEIKQKKSELQSQLDTVRGQESELENLIKSNMDVSDEFANLSEEEFQLAMSDLVGSNVISIEVVYAQRDKQTIREIQVPRGATIDDCIVMSSILLEYPDVDLKENSVGIHGMIKPLTEVVHEGDRVEIYRKVTVKI